MAVGKSKNMQKKGKGLSKKVVDPFTNKNWFNIRVPSVISQAIAGKTVGNRGSGNKTAADSVLGRVFEFNLADLKKEYEAFSYRKMKFVAEELRGSDLITSFHSMDMTTDKLRFLVRKWQSLIESQVDVKTTDGYLLRVFSIAFTQRGKEQLKRTSYAQSSQVREIRKRMQQVVTKEIATTDITHALEKFATESISKDMEAAGSRVFPLYNVFVRKVKVIKRPKFDHAKLMSMYTTGQESSAKVERTAAAPVADFIEPAISSSI